MCGHTIGKGAHKVLPLQQEVVGGRGAPGPVDRLADQGDDRDRQAGEPGGCGDLPRVAFGQGLRAAARVQPAPDRHPRGKIPGRPRMAPGPPIAQRRRPWGRRGPPRSEEAHRGQDLQPAVHQQPEREVPPHDPRVPGEARKRQQERQREARAQGEVRDGTVAVRGADRVPELQEQGPAVPDLRRPRPRAGDQGDVREGRIPELERA